MPEHSGLKYPYKIGEYMAQILKPAQQEKLSVEQIQGMLQNLADWVNVTEHTTEDV